MQRTRWVLAGFVVLGFVVQGFSPPGRQAKSPALAPPNEPARVEIAGDTIRIRYNGTLVYEARLNRAFTPDERAVTVRTGDAVDQVLSLHARDRSGMLELTGTATASDEAFPCESDRPSGALPVVRHSSGLGSSLLNNAVYDRRYDWVLSVDDRHHTGVSIVPARQANGSRTFAFSALGREIVLRFRPRFYQKHRGLSLFEPWTYRAWPDPVVGWSSWYAFFDRVTEQDIRQISDVMAEVLEPYGYQYVQIDDGYQRGTGLPELWLKPNDKFPSGLSALAAYIRSKGLTPGIWTNATFSQTDYAEQHKEWFVRDATGAVARGNWIDHPVDASVPAALDTLVRPIYRELRGMGWGYFKLDALRHLRYEGYNTYRDYFAARHVEPADAFRRYVSAVRDEIGRDRFLLACWGIRPELVGVVDGCRLGTDGFSYAGLAQFNSYNNVVWRNDPDHIELSDTEAWRSTMVTSLTGSMLLLTDKPDRYRTAFVDPARRAAPVLVTLPGQLYDVDPSRSSEIRRVDSEVSGRDPKTFDAGRTPAVQLYLLEVNRPFESWVVLGRTGGQFDEIRFEDLGLPANKEYVVFEFWQKKYVGTHAGGFSPGDLPRRFNSQVFVIRERRAHPQLVATSRHLTAGGVDLLDVTWTDGMLAGRSRVVAGDPYDIYFTEPPGWEFTSLQCDGAVTQSAGRTDGLVKAGCRPDKSGEIRWQARFRAR